MEPDELRRNGSLASSHRTADVAGQEREAAQHVRPPFHLEGRPAHLPHRVPAEVVVLAPQPVQGTEFPRGRGAHRSMVAARLFKEGPGFPTLHPGGGYRDPVNATARNRHVSADLLETLAPKQLAR